MPIYEYSCSNCGHYLTKLQKVSDKPIVVCPACGESKLTRLVSAAGFQLKGTGWYVTDFRNPPSSHSKTPTDKKPTDKTETTTQQDSQKDHKSASEIKEPTVSK